MWLPHTRAIHRGLCITHWSIPHATSPNGMRKTPQKEEEKHDKIQEGRRREKRRKKDTQAKIACKAVNWGLVARAKDKESQPKLE